MHMSRVGHVAHNWTNPTLRVPRHSALWPPGLTSPPPTKANILVAQASMRRLRDAPAYLRRDADHQCTLKALAKLGLRLGSGTRRSSGFLQHAGNTIMSVTSALPGRPHLLLGGCYAETVSCAGDRVGKSPRHGPSHLQDFVHNHKATSDGGCGQDSQSQWNTPRPASCTKEDSPMTDDQQIDKTTGTRPERPMSVGELAITTNPGRTAQP